MYLLIFQSFYFNLTKLTNAHHPLVVRQLHVAWLDAKLYSLAQSHSLRVWAGDAYQH